MVAYQLSLVVQCLLGKLGDLDVRIECSQRGVGLDEQRRVRRRCPATLLD
jgi:hypothetical protein